MPLYRKTSLTQIDEYVPGMEDGIEDGVPYIQTKEGRMAITDGAVIATGAEGERWPIKRSIFESTYELASLNARAADALDAV